MNNQLSQEEQLGLLDFARLLIEALEAAGAQYMIGGALAVSAWAEARSTQDVDIVVSVPFEHIQRLSEELEKRDMLVPADIIINLWLQEGSDLPINAIHLYAGFKAEIFLVRPGDAFRATAFARRRRVDLGPPLGEVYVHAPEDLILYKLQYFKLSQQSKHMRDIISMIQALGDELDRAYIEQWAGQLGVVAAWQEMLHTIA